MSKYGLRDKRFSENEVQLKKVSINGNICGEFVEFSMAQVYENKAENNIDAVYIFPLPDTAVLTGFEAILGGKSLRAIVEDKEDSYKIYENALESGINIISIDQDEDNIFTISIGSILPNETVKINITYMDQLLYEDSSFKLMIPSIIAPQSMEEEEVNKEKPEYKLSLNLLVESFNKLDIHSPTHGIHVHREDDTLCKVSFKEGQMLHKDFVLMMKETKNEEYSGMIYNYNNLDEEEGVLYLRIYPKLDYEEGHQTQNYDFLIDISDSMEGDQLEEAKNAVHLCLRNLDEGDNFNIIAFSEEVKVFSKEGKVPYNDENLEKASEWIDDLKVEPGANVFETLKYALQEKNREGNSTILLFTDDMVEEEDEIIDYVKENINDNRIFPFGVDTAVNSYFINKMAEIGYGRPEFIYAGERIDDMVLRQFNRITNPQVDVISIDWGAMKVQRTYPRTIDYLYDREPISIFAKVSGEIGGKVTIKGKVGEEDYIKTIDLDKLDLDVNADLIEKVWARKRIESLTEKMRGERGEVRESMRKKVIELSKDYGIISKETSFVMLEEMEEPVLGMAISNIIPIQISEEAMENISEGYFLDSPSFFYKVDIREKMVEEGMDKEKAKKAIIYDRENLLRIIAKNQLADGAFCNKKEENHTKRLESTLISILAFTLGKEDVKIYMNQINKSLRYVLKSIEDNEGILNEKITHLVILALRSSIEKKLVRQPSRSIIEDHIDKLKNIIKENKYMDIQYISNSDRNIDLRDSTAFMLSLNEEKNIKEEFLINFKEGQNILDIAKLAIQKTL
ncbi:VIT domain-containing protein [Clostridium amazonitimonense]|uniref:VIT domain-containing protein n=1 Tax=Clostridium amazonitimonense TaxID=1499689 RepID=UPI0005094697|nr:VIT domain-containing protein [Clostridium amazonitimonense]